MAKRIYTQRTGATQMTDRFTTDNTEGYSPIEIAKLNTLYAQAVHLPPTTLAYMGDLESGSWEDHCAEQVLADFDWRQAANWDCE